MVNFENGVNLILGPNAAGKTSLLEAIHLFSAARSFRSNNLNELIAWGEKGFALDLLFEKNGVEQRLSFAFDGEKKLLKHNQTPLGNLGNLLGILPVVTLTPYDIELIIGAPKLRRQFLDLALTQLDPLYFYHLTRYLGAMKRRNLLLKKRAKEDVLLPFNELMSSAATGIHQARQHLLQSLDCGNALTLDYIPSYFDPTLLKKERELGFTLSGPQKDDFTLQLHGKPAKAYASEGQKRYSVMTLKIALYHHIRETCNEAPLLCIDDVGMGFDVNRVKSLASQLKDLGQVLLSSCRPLEGLLPSRQVIVEAGTIQEEPLQASSAPLQAEQPSVDAQTPVTQP